ncbi:GTP-binding protein AGP-1 [Ditylenchus destructor]|uniref:GTP-binding protein AGP-1 n=1 Tax=Ditylenchus destructor TaxID=166010 RepID=A0AAD4RBW2_9BILA|nr:GTP-binding protein AGP-1 [Ditylenchus destructor]
MDNNGPNQAVAALFNDASSDAEMEEMDTNMTEDVPLGKRFLIDLNPDAAAKYRDYLKEQLLSGEGETVVEIGTAIDTVEDEKGLNEAEVSQAEKNHNKLLTSINCLGTILAHRCDNNCHTRVVMIRSKVEETNFIEGWALYTLVCLTTANLLNAHYFVGAVPFFDKINKAYTKSLCSFAVVMKYENHQTFNALCRCIERLKPLGVRDSSSPGQFITRDNSSPATIHHLRQFITCDSSSPGQFITCDNSSPATIHHP